MRPISFVTANSALALIVLGLIVAIGVRAPVFVTPESLIGVLTDTSFLFMLTLAQMVVILTRGIDLSVAANLALVGMICRARLARPSGLPILDDHRSWGSRSAPSSARSTASWSPTSEFRRSS